MSPGTLRRTECKMKEDFNQTYFRLGSLDLTPSHIIRKGGGFIGQSPPHAKKPPFRDGTGGIVSSG